MSEPPGSPTLDQLLTDPCRAASVPIERLPALLRQCSAQQHRLAVVEGVLAERLAGLEAREDRLLTAEEAAARLACTVDWLRRRAGTLPFEVRPSESVVRYSSQGITEYISRRMGKPAC